MLCLKRACLVGFDIIVIFLFCLVLNNDGPEENPGRAEAVVKQLEFLERKTQNLVIIYSKAHLHSRFSCAIAIFVYWCKIRLNRFVYTHTGVKIVVFIQKEPE